MLLVTLFSLLSLAAAQCPPEFQLASYYASNMVLQRPPARPRVWGYAPAAGQQVVANLDTGAQTIVTDSYDGPEGVPIWEVTFQPISEEGPHSITFQLTEASCVISIDNVLIGDVWICSGQSNMAHQLQHIDNPQADLDDVVNYPNVRSFYAALVTSPVPVYDLIRVQRNWEEPTPTNMAPFSAVCWLFGRNLFQQYGRPVGIIESNWGGTRIEAWSSPEALDQCFTSVSNGSNAQNNPSYLYNSMIHPFFRMPIYGAIWYQGEANTGNAGSYSCAIKAMVNDWRSSWYDQNPEMDSMFPFGQVQLAPNTDLDIATGFPDVRWAQADFVGYNPTVNLQKFFMAVAVDLPDFGSPQGSIHPRYKRQVAQRLALGAFNIAYNTTSTGIFQGPLPTGYSIDGDNVRISYGMPLEFRTTTDPNMFEFCCGSTPDETCESGGSWAAATFVSGETDEMLLSNPCEGGDSVTGFRYLWRVSPCKTLESCPVYSVENSLPAPPYLYHGVISRNGKHVPLQ